MKNIYLIKCDLGTGELLNKLSTGISSKFEDKSHEIEYENKAKDNCPVAMPSSSLIILDFYSDFRPNFTSIIQVLSWPTKEIIHKI